MLFDIWYFSHIIETKTSNFEGATIIYDEIDVICKPRTPIPYSLMTFIHPKVHSFPYVSSITIILVCHEIECTIARHDIAFLSLIRITIASTFPIISLVVKEICVVLFIAFHYTTVTCFKALPFLYFFAVLVYCAVTILFVKNMF